MNYKPTRFAAILLAALASTLLLSCKRSATEPIAKPASPVSVKIVHPHKGEITRSVTLPGNVLPYQQATRPSLCRREA